MADDNGGNGRMPRTRSKINLGAPPAMSKEELALAGRRKLEEFRKKKAGEKLATAKKKQAAAMAAAELATSSSGVVVSSSSSSLVGSQQAMAAKPIVDHKETVAYPSGVTAIEPSTLPALSNSMDASNVPVPIDSISATAKGTAEQTVGERNRLRDAEAPFSVVGKSEEVDGKSEWGEREVAAREESNGKGFVGEVTISPSSQPVIRPDHLRPAATQTSISSLPHPPPPPFDPSVHGPSIVKTTNSSESPTLSSTSNGHDKVDELKREASDKSRDNPFAFSLKIKEISTTEKTGDLDIVNKNEKMETAATTQASSMAKGTVFSSFSVVIGNNLKRDSLSLKPMEAVAAVARLSDANLTTSPESLSDKEVAVTEGVSDVKPLATPPSSDAKSTPMGTQKPSEPTLGPIRSSPETTSVSFSKAPPANRFDPVNRDIRFGEKQTSPGHSVFENNGSEIGGPLLKLSRDSEGGRSTQIGQSSDPSSSNGRKVVDDAESNKIVNSRPGFLNGSSAQQSKPTGDVGVAKGSVSRSRQGESMSILSKKPPPPWLSKSPSPAVTATPSPSHSPFRPPPLTSAFTTMSTPPPQPLFRPHLSHDHETSMTKHMNGIDSSSVVMPLTSNSRKENHRMDLEQKSPDRKHESSLSHSSTLNDFSALEQHIEDLTKEKFALQHGLEASRALTESLAQENNSLMDDFNRQGAAMTQLKQEIERLRKEIEAQKLVLATSRLERERAEDEKSSAVERSQTLAAEVIGLEEKVLRMRSQELKVQQSVDRLTTELEAQKRAMGSLEKDRASLRAQIATLQEEKRGLQSRLRKAAVGGVLKDMVGPSGSETGSSRVDTATSTKDLEVQSRSSASPFAPVASSSTNEEGSSATGREEAASEGAGSVEPEDRRSVAQVEQPQVLLEERERERESEASVGLPFERFGHSGEPESSSRTEGAGETDREDEREGERQDGGVEELESQRPRGIMDSASIKRVTLAMSAAFSAALASPGGTLHQSFSMNIPEDLDSLPDDDQQTAQVINGLLDEIRDERRTLVRMINAEKAATSELRVINADLSRKLAIQTQRLELAVAQSMAASRARPSSEAAPITSFADTREYIDEGDEVAERVLTWILRLFPGSRRSNSGAWHV